jgi:GTPase SAR1 family protein
MKYKYLRILFYFISIVAVIFSSIFMSDFFYGKTDFSTLSSKIFTLIFFIIIGLSFIISITSLIGRRIPQKFSVAIIGFPRSGKTTLLMSLFDHILSKKIEFNNIKIEGSETIERVNHFISLINIRKQIPPTQDQEIFAYRTSIKRQTILGSRIIKIEFGDFPGEQSKEFSEKYNNWFHRTPYFKWVKDADAYIFIVDFGDYLINKEEDNLGFFVSTTTASMRAAWQHLIEYNYENKFDLKRNPIILLFSKLDLAYHYYFINKIITDYNNQMGDIKFTKKEYIEYYTYKSIPNIISQNNLINPLFKSLHEFINYKFDNGIEILHKVTLLEFLSRNYKNNNIDSLRMLEGYVRSNCISLENDLLQDFSDLLKYFNSENKFFKKLFISSFGDLYFDGKQSSYNLLLNYLFANSM